MNLQCPICHGRFPLEAVFQDGAALDLVRLMASRPVRLSRPLMVYLSLFRSPSRAQGWERALRLAEEVLQLERDEDLLGAAVSETVESLLAKREREPARPLKNHNYLRRVLESLQGRKPAPPEEPPPPPPPEPPPDPKAQERVKGLTANLFKSTGGGQSR